MGSEMKASSGCLGGGQKKASKKLIRKYKGYKADVPHT